MSSLFRGHVHAYREVVGLLTQHRQLTWEMAKREITDKYTGQVLGAVWAVLHPVLLMGIYVFIFAVVFKAKIGGTVELPLDYTAYLLAGLVPWMGLHEAMVKSSSAILGNANLVKQVVFPLEVLPVKGVIASMLTVGVSLIVLVIYVLATHHRLHLSYALLPVLVVLQIFWMIGLSYVLSAIGAFLRDTKDFVQVAALISMYLTPIFYLPDMVPELFRPVIYLNPFSYLIWCYQDVLYFGRMEHPIAWIVMPILALGSFGVGYRVFRKVKILFGNVL